MSLSAIKFWEIDENSFYHFDNDKNKNKEYVIPNQVPTFKKNIDKFSRTVVNKFKVLY